MMRLFPQEVVDRLSQAVQPLVFETGVEEAPYSISGTTFLVGHERSSYVLTARHALKPEDIRPVCIFPSDTSQRVIPLSDVFFVSQDDCTEDYADIAVMSIDMKRQQESEIGDAVLIDLGKALGDWKAEALDAEFVVMGYPNDLSFVDYDEELLHSERVTLRARYIGSSLPHLHVLEIVQPHSLKTFGGFSGSPVFMCVCHRGKTLIPTLCGMVLRGTASAGRMHFVESSTLVATLNAFRLQS
ncbi:trypsin-like peptidase domain-containing protein [Uliginosibacterium sp. 31-12]|uniref:trypsin-like peptidase domain-containing protein n=1 Tax=Uliginosibacterium sp. 31-12 TaxID=3062781 RepID=UPI0026E3E989|nr:trypsin-like peptidase domain-containing protein [Uliginosibacterium sp. 31-12]MDO6386806.1 hypothetical protein [Uliginosibacterium sp. 31-12]